MDTDSTGFFEKLKQYFGSSPEPTPKGPYYGLENKTPYDPALRYFGENPHSGFLYRTGPEGEVYPYGVRNNYWEDLKRYEGIYNPPKGEIGLGNGFSQTRVPELIYPTIGDYTSSPSQMPSSLYTNGMAYEGRGVPNNIAPKLVEQKRVIRFNTPEEKASFLASQNERGFQLVGEPYNKYIESRTQLGSAIPYASDYRSGTTSGPSRVYTPADFPNEYMNNSRFRSYVNNYAVDGLSKAGKIAGSALLVGHALKEGPVDALVTATMGPIGRISPISDTSSAEHRDFIASKRAEEQRQILETLAKQKYYEENFDSINATNRMFLGR